jgi:hypothetical protein
MAGRKHNRLSVRPFITCHIERDENTILIYLRNDGLGPALIKGFYVKLGNKEVVVNPNNNPYKNWALSGGGEIIRFKHEYFIPTIDSTIKANHKVQLLKVTFGKESDELLDLVEEQFSFQITYTSMYEDKLFTSGI